MDGEQRRGSFRSFALGGLVGASAAIAAVARRRRLERRRSRARGLAAFETAPCYHELLERERDQPQGQSAPQRSPI